MLHRLNNLKTLFILFIISMSMAFHSAHAQVKYDGYSFVIDGVLLLQDSQDTMAFYYMPKAPSVSYKKDSTLEFLCMKYVGENDQPSGGLLHALFEFTVPEKELKAIELKLKKKFPGGKIKGQLKILPNSGENGEDNSPGFEVISAVLQNGGEGGMTRSLVASGSAPLTPGSKAAVAALLDSRGATLLWASMEGPTSDISVGVRGYYEAILPSFNAKIVMNSESVHKAFSEKRYKSTPLTQNDIQKGIDSLIKSGTIKVEIVDRSKAFNLDNAAMQSLTDLLTTKAIDMMFVGYVGPSTTPGMGMGGMGMGGMGVGGMGVGGMGMGGMGMGGMGMGGLMGMSSAPMNVTPAGIPPAGIPMDLMGGLAAGGALGAASGGSPQAAAAAVGVMAVQTGWGIAKDVMLMYQKTYTLVDRKNIRQSSYTINLSKASSIKVPFYSAGNISGFFNQLKNDKRYFRIVNMNDPAFQKRDINFIIDNDYADAFNSILNFVSINFRKSYSNGQDTVFSKMTITKKDIDAGTLTSYGLKGDGTSWSWGRDSSGSCGVGIGIGVDTLTWVRPQQNGSSISSIFSGNGFAAWRITTNNRELWACGGINCFSLPPPWPPIPGTVFPIQVGVDGGWSKVATYNFGAFAIKQDGTLWKTIPGFQNYLAQVGTETWLDVASGAAIRSDGTLWTLINNNWIQIPNTGTGWKMVSAWEGWHYMAIKSNGTLWGWGVNTYGQIGNGNTSNISSPIQIGTDANWLDVSAGGSHTIATKTDGSVWTWGLNSSGQLGTGDFQNRLIPFQIYF